MKELSLSENAIYDRQIRLWGVKSQQRIMEAHGVVIGLNASCVELVKNLTLAGVRLSLVDTRPVTHTHLTHNFFLREDDIGQPLGEACVPRVCDMNPLTGY
eukprot:GHVR01167027.1.p1 GENE.GHVR01167027.1~~GHVR01167027.1.p1  ORF type:complete len:101 (+),score=33.24 GHVR01167027.1:27-329(+)